MNTTKKSCAKKTLIKKFGYVILPLLIIAGIGLSQIQLAHSQGAPTFTLTYDFYNNNEPAGQYATSFLGDEDPYTAVPPYANNLNEFQCNPNNRGACQTTSLKIAAAKTNFTLDAGDHVYIVGKIAKGTSAPTYNIAPDGLYSCSNNFGGNNPNPGGICNNNPWVIKKLAASDFTQNSGNNTDFINVFLKSVNFVASANGLENKYIINNLKALVVTGDCAGTCSPKAGLSGNPFSLVQTPVFKMKYWPLVTFDAIPAPAYCTDFTANHPAPSWTWNYESGADVPTPPTGYKIILGAETYDVSTPNILAWRRYPDPFSGAGLLNSTVNNFTLPTTVSGVALKKNGEFLPGSAIYKATGKYIIWVEENWRPSDPNNASTHQFITYPTANQAPNFVTPGGYVVVKNSGECAGRPVGLVTYNNNPTYQDPAISDSGDARYLLSPNANPAPYPEKNNEPAVIAYDGSWHDLNYQTTNTDDKKCSFNGQNSWTASKLVSFTKPVFKFIYSMRSADKQFGFSANGSAITGYEVQLQKYVSGAWVNEGGLADVSYDNSGSKITKNCWFPTSALDRSKNYRVKVQALAGSLKSDIFYRELPSDTRPSYLQYASTNPVAFSYSDYLTDPTEQPADSAPAVQVATAANQTEYGIIKPSDCSGLATATQPVWSWQSPSRLPTYPLYEYGFKANGANSISKYVVTLEKSADSGNTWSADFSDNNYSGTCFRPASPLVTANNLYRLKVIAYDSQPNGGNPSDTIVRTLFGALNPPYVSIVYPAAYCSAFTSDQLWGINTQVTVKWQWGYTQPAEPAQYQQFVIILQKENKAPIYAYTFNPNAQNSFNDKDNTFQIDYTAGVVSVISKLNNNSNGILKYLLNGSPGAIGNNGNYNGRYILKVKTQLVNDLSQVSAERVSYGKVDLAPPNFPLGAKVDNVISPMQEVGWDDGTEIWQAGVSAGLGSYNMPANISGQSGYNNPYTFNLATKMQVAPYLKWPLDFSSAPVFSWLVNGQHTISASIADSACGTMNVWPFSPFTIQNTTVKSWALNRAGQATVDVSPPIVRPMTTGEYANFVTGASTGRYALCSQSMASHGWTQNRCDTDRYYLEGSARKTCDPTRPTDLAVGPDANGLNGGAYVWTRSDTVIPRTQPQGKNYNLGCEAISGAGAYQKDAVKTADNTPVLGFVVVDQGDLTCSTGGTGQCPTAATNFICTQKQKDAGCYCRSINTMLVDACAGTYTMNAPAGINPSTTSIEMALNGAFGSANDSLYRGINGDLTRKLSDLMGRSYPPAIRCSISTALGQGATAGYNKCEVMIRLPDFIWYDAIPRGNTWPYYESSLDPNNEWKNECLALSGTGQTCAPGTGNSYTGLHPERPDVTGLLGGGFYIYSTFKTASSIVDTPKYASPSTSPYRYQTYYQDNKLSDSSQSYQLRVNAIDGNNNTQNQIIKFRVNQNAPETP